MLEGFEVVLNARCWLGLELHADGDRQSALVAAATHFVFAREAEREALSET